MSTASHPTPVAPPADDPQERPYPGYARELAAMQSKIKAAQQSRGVAIPGALREAFAGEPRKLHGFTLQPVTGWLIAILTRIESPVLEIVQVYREHGEDLQAVMNQAEGKEKARELKALEKKITAQIKRDVKPGPDAAMETVFAFVTDAEKLQELLDEDRKAFTKAARARVGKLHPNLLGDLERACGEHFSASYATALSISPVPPEHGPGDDGTVFCQPPAEVKTASAGGSKSSAP